MGRRGYPPEFRRKVLNLVESGRKVADVARKCANPAGSGSGALLPRRLAAKEPITGRSRGPAAARTFKTGRLCRA